MTPSVRFAVLVEVGFLTQVLSRLSEPMAHGCAFQILAAAIIGGPPVCANLGSQQLTALRGCWLPYGGAGL